MTRRPKISIIIVLILGVACGAGGGVFFALTHDLPQIQALESFRPSATTRIYSADNILLSELFVEKREPVAFADIPANLKKAVITIEDRHFYEHSGIDIKGILRAAIKDVMARRFVEGASTITQQLAKTLFLTSKKHLMRKVKEAILSFQLERRYTKDEILSFYLNQIYLGSGAYGVKAAAKTYFDKPVQTLTLAECALIAGLPKSPSRYSPLINPDLAVKRRNIVLRQMLKYKVISETDYDQAKSEPLALAKKSKLDRKAPYFIDFIVDDLEGILGADTLYKGGLTISTTLDYGLQQRAEDAIQQGLADLTGRMRHKGIEDRPQGAAVSLDVSSGAILAMVGGRDYASSVFNRATMAKRQPGSAFKPLLYAYAVEQGYAQNALLLDAPVAFPKAVKGKTWRPENFSNTYRGEISLRYALVESKNIPAVRLIDRLGVAGVVRFCHTLGIQSDLSPYLSLALGTSEITLMELTAAYATFPNQGEYIQPYGVSEIVDASGRLIWQMKPQKKWVLSRVDAAIMTDMLTGVVQEGTGRRARRLGLPVAGKTGTTNDYRDALFIGFSPSVATGVWVCRDSHDTLGKGETGARAALPIWIPIMEKALQHQHTPYFDIPDGVVRVSMDLISGKAVPPGTAGSVIALFKKGTEPR